MEQKKGTKSVQDDDGSTDTPPCINNAKQKTVKKANKQNINKEVTITPTIIHQNSLQANMYWWKYAWRYDF